MPDQKSNEPYLSRKAREQAEKLGLTGTDRIGAGHNDTLDAFKHAYISAALAYSNGSTVAHVFGEFNELKGDLINDQPPAERYMDEFNNSIGRKIGSETHDKNDLGKNVYKALMRGELIIDPSKTEPSSPLENDNDYTPPASAMNILPGEWDWRDGPRGTGNSQDFDPSSLIKAFGGKTGFGRSGIGQVVLPTAAQLAQALIKSRRRSLEKDLIEIFTGKDTGTIMEQRRRRSIGTTPIVSNGQEPDFSDLLFDSIERMVGSALSRQRTRTSTAESERSQEARRNWNLSQGQQQAQLARMAQAGARNL